MKSLLAALLLLSSLHPLIAQSDKRAPFIHFVMVDSSIVSGRVVRQDSNVVVVRKRNGDLSYLETYQIVRQSLNKPTRPGSTTGENVTSFSLKDGATVYGRIVKQTPVAVVVRQPNGTQTYIDPGDILSRSTVPETAMNPDENVPVGAPYLLNSRTAFNPLAGQVYYRNTYLIRNELEAGITNGWSVGVIVNPLLTNLYRTSEYMNNAIYLNTDFGTQVYTRIGIPIGQKFRIGAALSAQFQHPTYFSSTRTTFMGQILTTFGEQRSNFTLGYTFRLGDEPTFLLSPGTLTIGGMQAISPSLTFISDNTIKIKSSNGGPFGRLSAALRIHSRNHAFDLGALSTVNPYNYFGTQFDVYPYLGYTVAFGKH